MNKRYFTTSLAPLLLTALIVGCSPVNEQAEQQTAPSRPVESRTFQNQGAPLAEPVADKDSVSAPASKDVREKKSVQDNIVLPTVMESESGAVMAEQPQLARAMSRREAWIAPPVSPPYGLATESYTPVEENRFINSTNDPLSTFSIDVDTASYSNIRRFINQGTLPPVGAVRIEEMINYFSYDYPEPINRPFSISVESGPCPWNADNRLVKIGVQAKNLPADELPPSNLIFLIDVSGSMNNPNKLGLLKKSMLMLVERMRDTDRIGIVVYAGNDRVALPPTPGSKKEEIRKAITSLGAGGSTHASSGIHTAYSLAEQSFIPKGNNRVILASDGDFNVGVTTRGELKKLIADKRQMGVYLTVLGYGMGNYHDDTMEILANTGNGNYAYIDSLLEAKKVLVKEGTGTLFTLARDVKIQVEFNPAQVGAYRLIGYENRTLADEDFKNDKKDAGEIGLGHSVTALYEIIPPGHAAVPAVDSLKYGRPAGPVAGVATDEILQVKLRYKPDGKNDSVLLTAVGKDAGADLASVSADFRFSGAVAGFGMLLRNSEFKGELDYPQLIELARSGKGMDTEGYRAEFIRLLESAELISR